MLLPERLLTDFNYMLDRMGGSYVIAVLERAFVSRVADDMPSLFLSAASRQYLKESTQTDVVSAWRFVQHLIVYSKYLKKETVLSKKYVKWIEREMHERPRRWKAQRIF